jgi:hypothetical protein
VKPVEITGKLCISLALDRAGSKISMAGTDVMILKKMPKNWHFFTLRTANFSKHWLITLWLYEKKGDFFPTANWRKSPKKVIITLTPDRFGSRFYSRVPPVINIPLLLQIHE